MRRQLDPNRDPAPKVVWVILLRPSGRRMMTAATHRAVRHLPTRRDRL